jgi:hypothetical protein
LEKAPELIWFDQKMLDDIDGWPRHQTPIPTVTDAIRAFDRTGPCRGNQAASAGTAERDSHDRTQGRARIERKRLLSEYLTLGAGGFAGQVLERPTEQDEPVPFAAPKAVNLQTARVLGLDVPPMPLARADEVIE